MVDRNPFSFTAWSAGAYQSRTSAEQLGKLAQGGVQYVALNPRWTQEQIDSTTVQPHQQMSPTDDDIRYAIRTAQTLGLQVFLKPQIDVTGGGWRGQIRFENEDAWSEWFTSYEVFITHYAQLAEEEGASLLSVGVELDAPFHRVTQGTLSFLRKANRLGKYSKSSTINRRPHEAVSPSRR
jgi:hypothetical protein